MFPFLAPNQRRHDHESRSLGHRQHGIDDLRGGLAGDRAAAFPAIGFAGPCEQDAEVVVNLGGGGDGRSGVAGGGTLLDGDGGRQSLDLVDVRLLKLIEKLPGIGGKRFDIFALALGKDGIERERRFAAAAEAGDDDELIARDIDGDILEIVLACAANTDDFQTHDGLSDRVWARSVQAPRRRTLHKARPRRRGESS
jgi:hypothetical protein